jgi:DNA-binding response OmpR family regulator
MYVQPLEQPLTASQSTTRRSILIVDDDEAMADVLSARLSKQGFETIIADSGQLGLALARGETPSVVLLDLRLPDMDGFELCRELVDDEATCEIPVIILSGLEQPDIIRRSRAAGCCYYVRKPYDPNALLALIHQAIDEAEQD